MNRVLGRRLKTDDTTSGREPKRRRTNSNEIIPIPEETKESRDRTNRFRIYQHELQINTMNREERSEVFGFGYVEPAARVVYTIDTLPDQLYRNAVDYNTYLAVLAHREQLMQFNSEYEFDREAWEEQTYYF